jgi:two-component system, chemotaxis family, chemotaxis protein CheY
MDLSRHDAKLGLDFNSVNFNEECVVATILAVDDSASMRQMVAFTLKGAGYDVVEAVDGLDALNKAKSQTFDCVVTDVNMPNKDGISLIKDLRAMPNYKFTPMLMLTTESGMDKKQQGKDAGATGWIVKPFNPDQLLKTIKKVME